MGLGRSAAGGRLGRVVGWARPATEGGQGWDRSTAPAQQVPARSRPPPASPTVDVSPALTGGAAGLAHVARQLDEVYRDVGFGFVVGHGIDRSLTDDLFEASARFHALPADEKVAIAVNEWHRGFIAMATSTIVTSSVAQVRRPNQSESFMVMHEVPEGHPDRVAGVPLAGPNQWPAAAPEIREPIERYEAALRALSQRLVQVIAVALGAPEHHFDPAFTRPVTFLRLLWYPPQPPDSPHDLYGSAPHTDYGFLTLLAQHRLPGLQVRTPDGPGSTSRWSMTPSCSTRPTSSTAGPTAAGSRPPTG